MNIPYVFKKCSKCGRWLVANRVNFTSNKKGKYGLKSKCKRCIAEYDKQHKPQYYEKNKEMIIQHQKEYYERNKEKRAQRDKIYYEKNRERILQEHQVYFQNNKKERLDYQRHWKKTPAGRACKFNETVRRRQRKEEQGAGINKEQWLEMMQFFDFKCAYSDISLNKKNRSIDHIIPIVNGGEHEVWNCVPMDKSLNSSKRDTDMLEWYTAQDFYDEERLDKIYEWQQYAYNKWSNTEEAQ